MKKIIKLGMAALTALTMVGCSSGSASSDEKVLTVGISPDYAPYESENKKGDIVGFDPDMMKCFEEYLSEEEIKETNKQTFITELLNYIDSMEENILYEQISKVDGPIIEEIFEYLIENQLINEENLLELEKLATNKKVLAIGEIGLDYHYDGYNKQKQIDGFLSQLKLAYKLKLPIVIHLRDAYEDMLNLLKENKELLIYGFVIHCYSGSLEFAKELLKLGAYFSFTGNITFKNARKTIEVIEFLPLDRIMVETDSPYLAPEPVRGTINEPKNVNYVFNKIREIKNIERTELDKIIRENVRNFYKI